MSTAKDTSYGNPTAIEKAGAAASLALHLPLVLGWTLLTSPFHHNNRHKSAKRVLGDKFFYHLTGRLNIKQLQWLTGTTLDVYEAYVKANKLPRVVDELDEGARLLWIGERRTDRVILYFHGGAFLIPMQTTAAPFWKQAQDELKSKGKDVGIAILQYSLVPTATFPTQLKQAVVAVQHLLSKGVQPQNIQLTGDSAGGNLVLQLISHILHPVPDVPTLTLSSSFRGAYLMSPWVSLTSQAKSMFANDSSDILSPGCLLYWGRAVVAGVPESQIQYLEAIKAPAGWFDGIDKVVERLLITAGDAECLRDDIVVVTEKLVKLYKKDGTVRFMLQKYGVHNDPFFNFSTPGQKPGEVTPTILQWFAAGFKGN
ncbi:putative steryl acetyl hydrolase mug81 [Hypsizygus marmoreus]|uniref:Steryl acetyl hydrolase mug81 n=1 Tax=Hypsizygus marmoreus TaxID=39966 RepID=A0A369JF66_HYPMA|nr:putative steryl acetyl hydrolase mug81 [Hypsizygus marmoreus]